MRTINAIGLLSITLLANAFSGCAAQVEMADGVDGTGRQNIDQQFADANDCIEATLPENGCTDYSTLKQQSYDICHQAGLELVGLSIESVEGCDIEFAGSAHYQCCPTAPPPPPPVPGVCTNGSVGDGVCVDYSSLKLQAEVQCKEAGLWITAFGINSDGGCADGTASGATYECCSSAPPPPPPVPGDCTIGTVGNGNCQTLDQFKIGASDACNQMGGGLIDIQIDFGSCVNGEALVAKYVCITGGNYCAGQPPPSSGPGVCTNGTVGDGTCQTYDQFKIGASNACNQVGAGLIDLQIDVGSCTNGEALSGTYVCISGGDYCP